MSSTVQSLFSRSFISDRLFLKRKQNSLLQKLIKFRTGEADPEINLLYLSLFVAARGGTKGGEGQRHTVKNLNQSQRGINIVSQRAKIIVLASGVVALVTCSRFRQCFTFKRFRS